MTLGLPFLDAMVPAGTALAQTAAVPKLRTGFFYLPHGAIMYNTSHGPAMDKWTPSGSGADFKLSPILASLEPYKKYVSSFGNLENAATAGSVHTLHSCDVAQRHSSGHRQSARAHGHDSRSGDRENHRPGHAAAIARSLLGNHRSVGGGQRRLLYNFVFPRRGFAAADGIQSAQGLSCSCSARATRRRSAHRSATRPAASSI